METWPLLAAALPTGWGALVPVWVFAGTLVAVVGAEVALGRRWPNFPAGVLAVGAAAGGAVAVAQLADFAAGALGPQVVFNGTVRWDGIAAFLLALVGLGTALSTVPSLLSSGLRALPNGLGEYWILTAALLPGLACVAVANHLLVLYLGLELVSLAAYALTAYRKNDAFSAEAGVKYFLFGAVSSGVMLFGFSWLYGLTGQLEFLTTDFAVALAAAPLKPAAAAVLLSGVGLAFKLGAVPFHFWSPDAYTGAPAPAAGLLSTLPKAVVAVVLVRWIAVFPEEAALTRVLQFAVGGLAVGSLAVGHLGALGQRNAQRLLAYSSIGQAGFLLLPAVAGTAALPAVAAYGAAYVLMNLAAFHVLDRLQFLGGPDFTQWRFRPQLPTAIALVTAMVALTGLPPTVGFLAKLNGLAPLLLTGAPTGLRWVLLAAGIGFTAVGLYFYLRIPAQLLLQKVPVPLPAIPVLRRREALVFVAWTLLLVGTGIFGFSALLGLLAGVVR